MRTRDQLPAEVLAAFETLERAVEAGQIDGWRADSTDFGPHQIVLCVAVSAPPRLGG